MHVQKYAFLIQRTGFNRFAVLSCLVFNCLVHKMTKLGQEILGFPSFTLSDYYGHRKTNLILRFCRKVENILKTISKKFQIVS